MIFARQFVGCKALVHKHVFTQEQNFPKDEIIITKFKQITSICTLEILLLGHI